MKDLTFSKLSMSLTVLALLAVFGLAGCGSGGGGGANEPGTGGEITYTGATTQAKITVENANDIFSVIWSGGTSPATGEIAPTKGLRAPGAISTGRIIPYLFSVSDNVNHYIGGEKAKSIAAPKEINETKNGSVSGTLTKTGNIDENTGTGTLTLTYQNYNDVGETGGATLDGVLTVKVDAYDMAYKKITDMTMSFTLWTIKDKGRSISVSGSIRVQESLSNNTETQTYNVVIRDNNTNETSKQENFVISTTYNNIFTPSNKTETASGRVYIEKYGYVDVSTVSPFIYSAYPQDNPDKGGPVLLSGAGNSKAGITPVSTSKVRIEVDMDGDGTFESKNIYSWNDLAGLPAAPDATAPTVVSTNPPSNSATISVAIAITATFSEPMDPATITTAEFTLMNGTIPVSGAVTYNGTTATFTPSAPLTPNTLYTATITTGVKDLAGNQMSTNYSWTFTTGAVLDATAPTVLSTSPANAATGAAINTTIAATFSEPMDPATITTAEFTLMNGTIPVSGAVTYNGTSATFTPSAPLNYNTLYTATITTGVKDLVGNQMSTNYSWTFTTTAAPDITPPTVSSTSPVDIATGVALNTTIAATFSESIDPATITTAEFTLMNGVNPVSGTVTYSGTTATFTPAALLTPNTLYTATITTGVKDLAGNQLVGNYIWSFTTDNVLFKNYVSTATGSSPEAVAIGDVNGDGRNDVVMTTSFYFDAVNDYKVFVFLQNASGGLDAAIKYATSSTYTCRAVTVAIGDINHDGKNDVVIGNSGCGVEVFTQNTAGGLDPGVVYTSTDSHKIRIADLNNDGLLDVVGIGWGTGTASIWLQNGGGTLNAPVVYNVTHGGYDDLEIGDVNNDGLTDIVVMSGQSFLPNIGVLTQISGGTFNTPVYYSVGGNVLTQGVAVGNVNGDNLNDVVVTYGGNSGKIGVFTQNALGNLDTVVNYPSYDIPTAVEIADVTGDGRKDIVVLHNGWMSMGVYQQLTNGTLQAEKQYPAPYGSFNPHNLAIGDINGDGKNDAAIVDSSGLSVLYHY